MWRNRRHWNGPFSRTRGPTSADSGIRPKREAIWIQWCGLVSTKGRGENRQNCLYFTLFSSALHACQARPGMICRPLWSVAGCLYYCQPWCLKHIRSGRNWCCQLTPLVLQTCPLLFRELGVFFGAGPLFPVRYLQNNLGSVVRQLNNSANITLCDERKQPGTPEIEVLQKQAVPLSSAEKELFQQLAAQHVCVSIQFVLPKVSGELTFCQSGSKI